MIPPKPHGKLVSSKSILHSAVRLLQLAKRDRDGDETCNGWLEQARDTVEKIWCSVGVVIERSLLSATRGVRIESLGTFALDAKGRARFFLAADFVAKHRLLKYDACSGGMLAGGSVNTRLNVARVAATAGSARPDAERVLEAVLRSLHRYLASGRSVVLSFQNVADFICTPHGQAAMKFLRGFREKQKNVAAGATRARTGVARVRASPTPWATNSASKVLDTIRGAGERREKAAFQSTRKIAVSDSGHHTQGARQRITLGGRPRSASSCSTRTARTSRSVHTGRPETSHGFGVADGSSSSEKQSSTSCDTKSFAASSVGRTNARESPVGEASGRSTGSRSRHSDKNARRLTSSAAPTCSTSHTLVHECGSYYHKVSDGGHSDNDNGDGSTTPAQENARRKPPESVRVQPSGKGMSQPGLARQAKTTVEEQCLSGLLSRQTLAQAGQEGIRRLAEILRLTCMSTGKSGGVNSSGGRGGGWRLSGRDLLLALRDVGTTLTSAELAETTRVFRLQPDGRVSLPAILAGIRVDRRARDGQAARSHGKTGEEDVRLSCTNGGETGVDAAPEFRSTGSSTAILGRAPFCVVSETPAQRQAKWSPTRPPPAHHDEGGSHGDPSLSTPRLSESSTVARVLRKQREMNGALHEDIIDNVPVSGRSASAASTTHATPADPVASPRQDPRQCWLNENDDGGGGVGNVRKVDLSAELPGDANADLAGIVFDPPCSLERLLHVLQASKVGGAK